MDVVEDTLAVDIETFLARPLFCFLATASPEGPRVSPLWYLWEEGAVWIVVNPELKSYPDRIEADPQTALAVVDFDASRGLVQHVGMRGTASLEAFDPGRAKRLFRRYLGPEEWWDGRFHAVLERGERYRLVRFEPETVVARDQSLRAGVIAGRALSGPRPSPPRSPRPSAGGGCEAGRPRSRRGAARS